MAEGIAGGLSLEAVCAQPDMPCRSAVWKWTRAHPWFAELMAQARRRAETRRGAFDEALGAAIVARVAAGERIAAILADPRLPSHPVHRPWRPQQGHFPRQVYQLPRLADAQPAP